MSAVRERLLPVALLERPVRWIVGRDFFISYTRRDAARYAARLARLLGERHSVYLDQLDTPQGPELPPRLVRAVRRASTLVLVGSPGALASNWVRRELVEFAQTGRPVLLLDIAGALDAEIKSVLPSPFTSPVNAGYCIKVPDSPVTKEVAVKIFELVAIFLK